MRLLISLEGTIHGRAFDAKLLWRLVSTLDGSHLQAKCLAILAPFAATRICADSVAKFLRGLVHGGRTRKYRPCGFVWTESGN